MPGDTAIRVGIEKILFEEEWKNERIGNRFRSACWLGAGALALAIDLLEHGHARDAAPFVALGAGLAAFLFGRFWLRRKFHRAVPFVLTALDITLVTFVMHTVHETVKDAPRHVAFYPESTTALGLMLIIGMNVLRFSWRTTLFAGVYSALAYTWVLLEHTTIHTLVLMHYFVFACMTAVVIYAGRKLRLIIRRVKERDAFARFLPGPAVDRLTQDPLAFKLGGEEQDAAVLFADIRDFTALTENLPPVQVVSLLNEYFTEMVEEIFKWNGVLDKFIGDGICAVFGCALCRDDQAAHALRCALGMQKRLERINAARSARGEPVLRMGIGIHSGKLIAGSIGSPLRLEYTHIGDTVNTASRIESLCKEFREGLLASESAFVRAGGDRAFTARAMEPIRVKGKTDLLRVYAVDREFPIAGSVA